VSLEDQQVEEEYEAYDSVGMLQKKEPVRAELAVPLRDTRDQTQLPRAHFTQHGLGRLRDFADGRRDVSS
jgi:hypothetical protein